MHNFKEFIKKHNSEEKSNSTALSLPETNISNIAIVSSALLSYKGLSLTKSKAQKFGEEAINIATSDEVINELSDKIGKPLEHESEDEFVIRSKETLKKILRKKLFKK